MMLADSRFLARMAALVVVALYSGSCANGLDLSLVKTERIAASVKIEDVVVRLTQAEDEHYVSANFELQIAANGNVTKVTDAKPRLREGIISAIADRSLGELTGSAGIQRVKSVVHGAVDHVVGTGQVHKVFVTQFILY